MFKKHNQGVCGAPTIIDGWIIKFFPYNRFGKRNNFSSFDISSSLDEFSPEIVKVDVNYVIEYEKNIRDTIPLEFWSGFIGTTQNKKTFALTPQIGWMIKIKDTTNNILKSKLIKQDEEGGISIAVTTVPKALLELKNINTLTIYFTHTINLPAAMRNIKINNLNLYGEISKEVAKQIAKNFPNTTVTINNAMYTADGKIM